MTPQKPPGFILIALHSVLLFVYIMHDTQTPVQLIMYLSCFFVLLTISSIYHFILWLTTRKRSIRNIIRILLYFVPVVVFLLLGILLPKRPQPLNQTTSLPSPSRHYTMKMDIENNLWIVSIFDKSGKRLYRDDDSEFVGHLNVYWIWDAKDRLWLYNSDDGRVYFWEMTRKGWTKNLWSGKEAKDRFSPPNSLFPEYAR